MLSKVDPDDLSVESSSDSSDNSVVKRQTWPITRGYPPPRPHGHCLLNRPGRNTIWTSTFVGGLADRSFDPEGAEPARLMRPHLDPPDSECEAAVRSALCDDPGGLVRVDSSVLVDLVGALECGSDR